MLNRFLIARVCLVIALCCVSLHGQEIQPDQKERIDAAVPRKAQAKPKQPRRMLVTNLLAGIQYALGDLAANDAPDGAQGC